MTPAQEGFASEAGPSRTTEVAPERLVGWLERFTAGHGDLRPRGTMSTLQMDAADGSRVRLLDCWGGAPASDDLGEWLDHLTRDRTLALLLVRRGAHAVGVARGTELLAHHTDTHYVQGRTKAGGWSQQRYARRRANQADKAFRDAADDVVRVVLPHLQQIEALVCAGDRGGLDAVLADPRLRALVAKRSGHPVIGVPEPRHAVLVDLLARVRAVPIEVFDPPGPEPDAPPV